MSCDVEDCEKPIGVRGLCPKHYARLMRNGSPTATRYQMSSDPLVRIKNRVEEENGCWVWTGPTNNQGYGYLTFKAKRWYVHRLAYTASVGPIPEGKVIDHLCRRTNCCNPDHLEVVTQRENALRGIGPAAINARKTHCPQGHPYSPENTYVQGPGPGRFSGRICRTCSNRKR